MKFHTPHSLYYTIVIYLYALSQFTVKDYPAIKFQDIIAFTQKREYKYS